MEVMVTARDLLSRNVKRLRDAAEWDQLELASRAGLSSQMIQKIEQAKTSPSQETLDKLCKAFKCSVADLYLEIKPAVTKPSSEQLGPEIEEWLDNERAGEILHDLQVLLQKYSRAPLEQRLLALYVITLRESYLSRYEALPNSDRQVSATLRRSLGTS